MMSEIRAYGENSTALTVREEQVPSLLTGTPADRVSQASAIAQALAPVIDRQKLYVGISGKRHVLYEGWTTLGALVGVFPRTVWTRRTETGWEARVEAVTLDNAIVGAAESECSRDEKRWKDADDYAIRSMAQTRAGSKALRMPLGFIMALAGFEATPAEEITEGMRQTKPAQKKQQARSQGQAQWRTVDTPDDAEPPPCGACGAIMDYHIAERDGEVVNQAWVCPDYANTKHLPVYLDKFLAATK